MLENVAGDGFCDNIQISLTLHEKTTTFWSLCGKNAIMFMERCLEVLLLINGHFIEVVGANSGIYRKLNIIFRKEVCKVRVVCSCI